VTSQSCDSGFTVLWLSCHTEGPVIEPLNETQSLCCFYTDFWREKRLLYI